MIRQGFLSADDDSSGKIDNAELHKMFESFGHSNTEDAIADILKRFDTDNDGQISWLEYIDCYGELQGNFAHDYKGETTELLEEGAEGKKTFKQDNGIYGYTAFKEEEVHAFSNSINNNLEGDESVAERLPLASEHELFYGMSDGLLLIRLIQKLDPEAIFEGAVNKYVNGQMSIFKIEANINLALNALKGKIKMMGINASGFLELKPTPILSVLTQTCKLLSIKSINLKDCNEIWRLKEGDEELKDVLKLKAEQILIRWVNFHCHEAGHDELKIKNLGKDIADAKAMTVVLNQLDKANCSKAPLTTEDIVKRAEEMIHNSQNMKPDAVPYTASGKDITRGNTNVNTEFVANVFNTKHGLELDEEDMPDFAGMGIFNEEGSREERAFRYWINSLELDDTDLIENLYDACKDGKVLLRVCDKVMPGCVDWPATCGFPDLGSKIKSVRNPFDM